MNLDRLLTFPFASNWLRTLPVNQLRLASRRSSTTLKVLDTPWIVGVLTVPTWSRSLPYDATPSINRNETMWDASAGGYEMSRGVGLETEPARVAALKRW